MNCAGGDGLDLLAQGRDGQAMNSRQQSPLAPFDWSSCGADTPVRILRSVNFPRRIAPLASMRSKAFSISEAGSPSSDPNCSAVTGPRCVIQPVTIASTASSREGSVLSISTTALDQNSHRGRANENICARSAATQ